MVKIMSKTATTVSTSQIIDVVSKISDYYPLTNGFGTSGTKYGELSGSKSLPDFGDCKDIEFQELVVTGYLRSAETAWDLFSNFETNAKEFKEFASRISLSCDFKEKSDAQDSAYLVSVSLVLLNEKLSFGFSLNGAAVARNPKYWEAFYRKLINEFGLPLRINGKDLVHTQSGNVRITEIHPGNLPGGFICELLDSDLSASVARLKNGLSIFSMVSTPEFSWRITCDDIREANIGHLKDMSHFPADSFDVDLEFSVVGINGLDCLIAWCEDDDISRARICGFDLPDINSGGELLVETTHTGHKLLLSLPSDEKVKEIEQNLGVTFGLV